LLPSLLFYPEDGSSTFLRNINELLLDYEAVLSIVTAVRSSDPASLKEFARFRVFTAVTVKLFQTAVTKMSANFWDMRPCNPLKVN
jgi:hypothetical protein